MKNLKLLFLFIITVICFQSCEKDETTPERTTNLVKLENNTGITGCSTGGITVTFLVSYRDIQVDVDIEQGRSAFINVLVEDNESINIVVQNTSDDSTIANADINVRTDSRPDNLGIETRRISYCRAFDLGFHDF